MKNTLKKLCALFLSVLLVCSAMVIPSASVSVSAQDITVLPESVDNSQSPYFPEIGNQGSMGSCTSWAHVYYSFTYAMNKSRGIETTPENTYSPQWSYNLTSNGEGEGSTSADIEWFLEKQGAVTLSMVPYVADHVTWCSDINVWRESINNRLADTIKYTSFGYKKSQITSPDDNDLAEVKTALAQGEILTFATSINSWVTTQLTAHKNAPANAEFEGEYAVKYQDGAKGGHAMTIVGYNDNIWVDINSNGEVDAGEMGAFKIANSWGDGYCNDGFIWIAYDAVNETSSVIGVPELNSRQMIMSGIEGVIVRPYGQGSDIYIKYNFKADNRRDNYIIITAEKDGTSYTYKAFFPLLTLTSGEAKIPYDGNMLVALDNVVPDISAENFSEYTWSVTFVDKLKDDCETTYKDAEIVIESTGQSFKPEEVYPITLNGEEKTVEFAETELNHAVVYYRGYYNPEISYKVEGAEWVTSQLMDANTEREGYVNKFVIDLDKAKSAQVYFSDINGNKDNNGGINFTVEKGLNYFVTENVADPMEIELSFDGENIEKNYSHDYVTDVKGGYAPYSYEYTFKNLDTGEEDIVSSSQKYRTYSKSINKAGNYQITVKVTDYSGTAAEKTLNIEVIDSPFEFSKFEVINQGELFKGKEIKLYAETRYENIRRFGVSHETYDLVISKDGKEVYSAVIDPISYNHNKMTSVIEFLWTPEEAGKYTVTISGTDYGKDYAEISLDFEVVNKAYVYYRGYYSPLISYSTDGNWVNAQPMEECTDIQGYVNRYIIDLGDADFAQLYFSDAYGNKDSNGTELYKALSGESFFVTENAADPLTAELSETKVETETGKSVTLSVSVKGGYAPYMYNYSVENLATGEKSYSEVFAEYKDFTKAFDTEGVYKITCYVTDFSGSTVTANTEITVITPTEATTVTVPATTEDITTAPAPTETSSSADEAPVSSVPFATQIVDEVAGILGDADESEKVSIKDATLIQKYIANLSTAEELNLLLADSNMDKKINIKDATLIQKYLAKFEVSGVGELLVISVAVTVATEAATTEATFDEAEVTVTTYTEPTETTSAVAETTENGTEAPTVTTETAAVTTAEVTEVTTEATLPTEETTALPTEPSTVAPTDPPVETKNMVTFTNSFNWSGEVRCYYWSDSDTAMTAWPGVAMENAGTNDFGETLYTFEVPETAQYVIFTNGSVQTVDIPYSGGEVRYYPTSVTDSSGHYAVETW